MPRKARIQIRHNARLKQPFWYDVIAANGEIVVPSERFGSERDTRRAAKRLIEICKTLTVDDIVSAKD